MPAFPLCIVCGDPVFDTHGKIQVDDNRWRHSACQPPAQLPPADDEDTAPACDTCGRPIDGALVVDAEGGAHHFGCWDWEHEPGPWQNVPRVLPPIQVVPRGCVCPVGAEVGCRGAQCPRQGFQFGAGSVG